VVAYDEIPAGFENAIFSPEVIEIDGRKCRPLCTTYLCIVVGWNAEDTIKEKRQQIAPSVVESDIIPAGFGDAIPSPEIVPINGRKCRWICDLDIDAAHDCKFWCPDSGGTNEKRNNVASEKHANALAPLSNSHCEHLRGSQGRSQWCFISSHFGRLSGSNICFGYCNL
jgi:hypothetical protein